MSETTKTTRTAEEITADIIAYFENNEDDFNRAIEELDAWNGYLGDDKYYSIDEFDELHSSIKPSELLYRVFYGYDEDAYTTDKNGFKHYESFNPNREYFKYNGYGNLVSADYIDYSAHLDKWAIEAMSENRDYIDIIDESEKLTSLFDELESI